MSTLTLRDVTYSVGQFPLLDNLSLQVKPRERLAIIGRNGEGKSTLMKVIAGIISPAQGEVEIDKTTKVALVSQSLPMDLELTVYAFVAQGLQKLSDLLMQYHELTHQSKTHDEQWLSQLTSVQQKIEQLGGWDVQQKIEKVLSELNLPADTPLKQLSGGWRRKCAIAQCLVQEPEILLLDEPTNHLDIEAIQWLESRLLNYNHTILFVTHDRQLLRRIATGILDLDRGTLTRFPADYDKYVERKQKLLEEEKTHQALFDKKLAEEETWIRQGIKARRTRNEGRVRALKALREQRSQRREQRQRPDFVAFEVEKKGKTVIQADHISFRYSQEKPIIDDFSLTIGRGDKLAIIGPNGCGKTTLVKLLLNELTPTSGSVKHSPTNQIAFFEQTRAQLRPEESLIDNVAEGDDFIEVHGKRKHVIGYLGEFLFSPTKCHAKVNTLSGGEQNRLLLAKLFSKPANVFVLDEPTNDLDMETLELLESILYQMQSTVILISHDREFVDNVATQSIIFDDQKLITLVGGYSDWLAYQAQSQKQVKETKTSAKAKPNKTAQAKLSYHEQQTLKKLPETIEALEASIEAIQQTMAEPDFYKQEESKIKQITASLEDKQAELAQAYDHWESLEARK